MTVKKESEYFLKWKNFIETLTVDWLIENFESSRRRRPRMIGIAEISTYASMFEIHWEDIVYEIKSPMPSHIGLTLWEDENLSRYLSPDVLEEFIKVAEL